MDPFHRLNRGYSLIEVLIAMVVFGLLATGIIGATLANHRMTYEVSYQNTANDIAQGFINQLRTKSYGSLVAFANDNGTLKMSKIETDGTDGEIVSFFISNNTEFDETVLIGDIQRDGTISQKQMDMLLTFNVTDMSSTAGVDAVEIELIYSYSYIVQGGTRTLTDSIQTVRAR